ncbi:hypothetical protein EJM73_08415 [Clostridium botulinum]|uniref:hypothetical protein n=1 Tax=Clostridium botulinum TaxID=1491 RepID=UPI001375AED4|nr:hypothetical protein [Clostridium botulinum]NCI19923.1 hypothetical protein [Clostridium botulinum]NCI35685.1 hypothetical protein [Clostridium botulinum]NCI71818.1 hypothetical protein [Clostridium botulinum]NDI38734.1 hypothetical protein [Clostridium botulinum]
MNKHTLKMVLTNVLVYIGIFGSIIFCWQLLERLVYGTILPDRIDSFIAAFFTISLYYNYQNYMKNK